MTQKIKIAAALGLSLVLAGCGGGRLATPTGGGGGSQASFATGPISNACNRSDRKASNRQLCGCIQAVANTQLSSSDQSLAASFFPNPQKAQDTRQSDNPRNEAFWKRYKVFASSAERSCSAFR